LSNSLQFALRNHHHFFILPLQAELLNHYLFPELSYRLSLIALHFFGSTRPKAGHRIPPEGWYRARAPARKPVHTARAICPLQSDTDLCSHCCPFS